MSEHHDWDAERMIAGIDRVFGAVERAERAEDACREVIAILEPAMDWNNKHRVKWPAIRDALAAARKGIDE